MEDFVQKYKFVFHLVTATLKCLPRQVSKELLDTAAFCGTYDYSSCLSMVASNRFFESPYWVTVLKQGTYVRYIWATICENHPNDGVVKI